MDVLRSSACHWPQVQLEWFERTAFQANKESIGTKKPFRGQSGSQSTAPSFGGACLTCRRVKRCTQGWFTSGTTYKSLVLCAM